MNIELMICLNIVLVVVVFILSCLVASMYDSQKTINNINESLFAKLEELEKKDTAE